MAEVTHTPGPWVAHGSFIYAPDDEILAQVHNPGRCASDYPLIANRDLMAAAPDLLEALEYLVSLGGGDCLEPARAAIAKARGQ